MTTLNIGVTNTRPPMRTIRTSSPTDYVYESNNRAAADEASILQRHSPGSAVNQSSLGQESPERYIAADEYPLLAELWDNDADAIYDEM